MAEKVKIGQMSVNDLKNMVTDLKNELRTQRFNKVIGQAANTSRGRVVKRRIAAGMTILREYELGIRKPREARDHKDK